MDKMFITVLNMSLTGTFVIIVICLARFVLKKAPKAISYCLWAVAGFRLVFPFSIESVFSLMPFKAAPIPTDIAMQEMPHIDSGVAIVDNTVNTILIASPPDMTASINPLQLWTTVGAHIWLLGGSLMHAYGVMSFLILKRKMRCAVHFSANIYDMENIKSPFVLGVYKPNIYLPIGLSAQVKKYIILHEQTHIRRLDHIVKLVAFFILCLHWFNPLVWVSFRLMNADMEMSCDECVLKEVGHQVKKDYSMALLLLATERRFVPGRPLAFGEGGAKARIENILNFRKPSRIIMALSMVLVVVLSGVFAVDRGSDFGNAVYKDYVDYMLKHSKPLDNAVLSDGIRLRLLSGYKDQGSMGLLFSVTDEEGDRLSELTRCNVDFNYTMSWGNMKLTKYDTESKTATFFLECDFLLSETIGEEITFSLSNLCTGQRQLPGELHEQEGLDPYLVVKDHIAEIRKTTFFNMYDSYHLKGDQLHIPLEGFSEKWVHFSNAGFIDGNLHLQVANKDGTETARAHARISTLYLIDKNGNQIGQDATGRLPNETDEIRVLSFSEDGYTFREFIFPEVSNRDDLQGMKIVAVGYNYSYMSDGIWQTTFRLPGDEDHVTIPITQKITLGKREVNANQITLSPLYVRVYYDGFYPPDGDWHSAFSVYELPDQAFPKDEVFITYKDGTTAILDWCGSENYITGTDAGFLVAEKFSLQFSNPLQVIQLKNVKSITIYEQEFLL